MNEAVKDRISEPLLSVKGLKKHFNVKKSENKIKAVNDVSFDIIKGETIGIVGESGCGKSTLGHCIVKALEPNGGEIRYKDSLGDYYDLADIDKLSMKKIRKEIQLIFQDPYSSLNPRMTVFDIISEPLKVHFKGLSKEEHEHMVKSIAGKVGLNPSYLKRYPHAFSGGQRQRIGIARALITNPQLIVCDESVSALDVSVQAQVINLLKELQEEMDLTYMFISHDLSVVEYISDRVGVMYFGSMVEFSPSDKLFQKPLHPYTEALLSAIPIADPEVQYSEIALEGEIPNPLDPPTGCPFHSRCRYCEEICRTEVPQYREVEEEHYVACHRAEELDLRGLIT